MALFFKVRSEIMVGGNVLLCGRDIVTLKTLQQETLNKKYMKDTKGLIHAAFTLEQQIGGLVYPSKSWIL